MCTRAFVGVTVVLLGCAASDASDRPAAARATSGLIRAAIAADTTPPTRELARLYGEADHAPLWVDAGGRPSPQAHEALRLLAGAAGDGLDPDDYAVAVPATEDADAPLAPGDAAAFDVALSDRMLRFFRHLHLGRVDPARVGFDLQPAIETHDFVTLLQEALANGGLTTTVDALRPPLTQYQLLRAHLQRYRTLAGDPRLATTPPSGDGAVVRTGDRFEGAAALFERLRAEGDLAADAPAPGSTYTAALADGLARFQDRHGLAADGVLGPATREALAVPLAWRVRQIELALERLRWLPDLDAPRLLAVNIPMFHLWGWTGPTPAGAPTLEMRAIVGRAVDTRTPVFVGQLRTVIFRPYWNVPRSILLDELLPRIEDDPDYVTREGFEIVDGPGDDAPRVPLTAEALDRLRTGELRLRQAPGPGNALGLVKFEFPNDSSIYLHDTPQPELFDRTRRDFSHGCVRVEAPAALADWVLAGDPAWSRARVDEAMATGSDTRRVEVRDPVTVVLFYTTAAATPGDGGLRFAEDIYDHDPRLDRALAGVD